MGVENHIALHDAPDHLIARRKLFTLAAAVLAHQLLQSEASAMLPSLEGSPTQPTKPPLALMYHDINNPRTAEEEVNWVPAKTFVTQLQQLQETGYRFSTLTESLKNPDQTIALTFDDGLHTAYNFVFPLLNSKHIKATFFVPVDAILSGNTGNRYFMTTKQVKKLAEAGFEIGSHSFHHIPLTDVPLKKVKQEVEDSKEFLEDLIGKEVSLFAYPGGKHNPQIAELVFQAGYRAAFLARNNTRLGLNFPLDRFELPRQWVTLKTKIKEMLPTLDRRRNRLLS